MRDTFQGKGKGCHFALNVRSKTALQNCMLSRTGHELEIGHVREAELLNCLVKIQAVFHCFYQRFKHKMKPDMKHFGFGALSFCDLKIFRDSV